MALLLGGAPCAAAPRGRPPGRIVRASDTPATCAGVREIVSAWQQGRRIDFGIGIGKTTTNCSLILDRPGRSAIWPMAFYPGAGGSGLVEIVFQYLAAREPFDSPDLREQLRSRLNTLSEVAIPVGKLALHPNIPAAVLADSGNREKMTTLLAWFREQALATVSS